MADTVIVGCFFTILLINACNGGFGLPGLVDQDENSTHSSGTDAQLVEDKDSVQKMMVARYKCHQCEWQECLMGEVTLCTEALFCYKSSVRDSDGELRYSRGCSVASDHAQFTCRHKTPQGLSKRHAGQVNVVCCSGDLCNAGSFPPLAQDSGEPLRAPAWRLGAGLAVAALALAAVTATAVLLLRKTHRLRVSQAALHKLGADSNYFSSNVYTPQVTCAFYEGLEGSQNGVRATAAGDSTLREYLQGSLSSGSGSGLPLMVQRTLSKQVTLLECVGKGRYGSVWRGLWCADSVAVKIFFSRDEASWRRETEIYSTVLLRHSNILAYVGSDMTSRNSCTQLWLITHFHPLGSLYEHLGRTTLTRQQMMVMSLSIVNGLLHLHTDIHGTQGKPAIAHRDIKSKNILVKVNGECCIADFGLAMTAAHAARAQPGAPQGTTRYMSPELLDHSMNVNCLEAWRRCDMYALALVLWELARRVAPAREARAPFAELTPADPSRDLMRKLVAVDAARPTMPTHTHPMSQRNRRGRPRHPPQELVIQDIFQRLNFTPPKPLLDTQELELNFVNMSPMTIPVSFKALPNYIKSVCHLMERHDIGLRKLMENIDVIIKGALILAEAKVCCAQIKTWIGSTKELYDFQELKYLNMMTSGRKLPYPLALYLDCLGNTQDRLRMVTPVLAEHAPNPKWSGALTWAPRQLLPLLLELCEGVRKNSTADAVRNELQGLPKIEWEEYNSECGTRMIRLSDDSYNFWIKEDKIRWEDTDYRVFTDNFTFVHKTANIAVDLLNGKGSQAQFVQTLKSQVGEHVEWFVMTEVDNRCIQLGTAFRFGATWSDANNKLTGPKGNAYMSGTLNPTPIFNKIISCYDTITGSSMRTHPNPDDFRTREVAKLMSGSLMPSTLGPLSVHGPVKIPVSFTGLRGFIDELWNTMKIVRWDTAQRFWTMDNKDVFFKGALILAEAKVCCAQKKCYVTANVSGRYTWGELISLNGLAEMKLPYPLAMYLECLGNTRDRSREVTPVLAEHATNPEWSGALTWAPRQLLPLLLELRAGFEIDSAVDAIRSKLQGLPKIEWEEYNSERGTQMVRLSEDSFNFWVMEDTQSTDDARYKIRWEETDRRLFSNCITYLEHGPTRGFNIPVNLLHGLGSPAQFVQIEWEAGEPVAWFAMTEVDDVSAQLGAAFRFSAVEPIANQSVLNGTRDNAYMYSSDLEERSMVYKILSWEQHLERNDDRSDSSD